MLGTIESDTPAFYTAVREVLDFAATAVDPAAHAAKIIDSIHESAEFGALLAADSASSDRETSQALTAFVRLLAAAGHREVPLINIRQEHTS